MDYDLLIDFSEMLRVKQMMFINLCKAKQNFGINKKNWKMFDVSIDYNIKDKHITDRYKKVLEKLGVEDPELSYELYFTEDQENVITSYSIHYTKLYDVNFSSMGYRSESMTIPDSPEC